MIDGSDIAAIVTAAGGAVGAVATAIALLRRKSTELQAAEQRELEDCSAWRRVARRIIRELRDALADAGVPEPEGIDDDLGLAGRRSIDTGDTSGQ